MKIAFQGPTAPGPRWQGLEFNLIEAFKAGAEKRDWQVFTLPKIADISQFDMIGIIGVKSQDLLKRCVAARKPFVYFDKAYNRKASWWRFSYCSHNPARFLTHLNRLDDRRLAQKWEPAEWQINTNGHILLAGSSGKYHRLYDLPDPTEFWKAIVSELQATGTDRKILYRPKKSWHDAVPIDGTEFSKAEFIEEDLKNAALMITHGSNSCFESLMLGIPAIVLGNGITAGISSSKISEISNLLLASQRLKIQLLNDLAYMQFKVDELKTTTTFWDALDDCTELYETL